MGEDERERRPLRVLEPEETRQEIEQMKTKTIISGRDAGLLQIEKALSVVNRYKTTAVSNANVIEALINETISILENCPQTHPKFGSTIVPLLMLGPFDIVGGASGYYSVDCSVYVNQAEAAKQSAETHFDRIQSILSTLTSAKDFLAQQCRGRGLILEDINKLKEDLPRYNEIVQTDLNAIEDQINAIIKYREDYLNCIQQKKS